MAGIFSTPRLQAMIELTHIYVAPKQWMRDIMHLPLHKKAIDTFLETLAEECKHHVTAETTWHSAFQTVFLPFSDDSISDFKPGDDLLYRLKFLNLVSNNQMSRTLYIAMLEQRVLCGLNLTLPNPVNLLEVRASERLKQLYDQRTLDLDDYFIANINKNPGNTKYIHDLNLFTKKLNDFIFLFRTYQANCGFLVALIKLGEFLHKVFPHTSQEEIKRQLSIFAWEFRQHGITEGTGITLAQRAMKNLKNNYKMTNGELNSYVEQALPNAASLADLRLGIEAFISLVDYPRLAQDTTKKVENTQRFKHFIVADLLPNTERRKTLEAAIAAVEKYAFDKYQLDERDKSRAASDLVWDLCKESMEYFSNPRKTPEKLAEFQKKCQAAITEANAVIGIHTSSSWELVLKKLGAALLVLATGGIALLVNETCRATLFSNKTRGERAVEQVSAVLTSRVTA
jgi:hypothetical protein